MKRILEKHQDILSKMKSEQIFELEAYPCGDLYIREMCDEWFNTKLSKDECLKLSELFKDLGEAL